MYTEWTERLQSWVSVYLAGAETLNQFVHRFSRETTEYDRWDDLGARSLAAGIELLLAEYTQGEWTEADLQDELASLLSDERESTTNWFARPPAAWGPAITAGDNAGVTVGAA